MCHDQINCYIKHFLILDFFSLFLHSQTELITLRAETQRRTIGNRKSTKCGSVTMATKNEGFSHNVFIFHCRPLCLEVKETESWRLIHLCRILEEWHIGVEMEARCETCRMTVATID